MRIQVYLLDDDLVVVVFVLDATMLSVEVFGVVVPLDVVVVFDDLSSVILAVAVVMCVAVSQGQVDVGTLVTAGLREQVTVCSHVVTVVEVTGQSQNSVVAVVWHQYQSLRSVSI